MRSSLAFPSRLSCLTLAAGSLLASACSLDEMITPSGRSTYTGPATLTIGTSQASVVLHLDTFGMTVANAAGTALLASFDGTSTVAGDTAGAYGALGGTYHDVTLGPPGASYGWDREQGTDYPWRHATQVASASATATSASVDLFDPADPSTTFHLDVNVDGADVLVDARVSVVGAADQGDASAGIGALNQMGQSFVLPPDEHFFGLGEKKGTVDHRGQHYESWCEEGAVGQGEGVAPGPTNPSPNGINMTNLPVPFYLSSRGYGVYMETTYRTGYSFGADDPGLYRIYAAEPHLRYHVFVHDDPRDTLADYTALTGRARLPAPWVFGPRRRVDDDGMVNGIPEYQALRNAQVPTTVVDDATHFLPIGSEVGEESVLEQRNLALHALGFKSVAYYNAFVSTQDPRAADLYAYGEAHDLFVKMDDGTEFDCPVVSAGQQEVATIDLTNPEAVTWYGTILQRALDLSYDGWMLDFGEYIPEYAVMHDGTTGWQAHNAFPVVYQTATFDYVTAQRGSDFMFFARSGYAGTQAVAPIVWSGDPAASFDQAAGLPAQVRGGINAGISGLPFWGSDISGYTCVFQPAVDKDVYLRWAEFGALSTDMHDENACSGNPAGNPPKWTLWSDAETTQVYAQYALLHTRLFPYTYAAANVATQTGLPIMRHPILLHPTEPSAALTQYEYYFGPALYVAPIVERAATTRTFWLPPGTWVDFWTNEPVVGGVTVTRDAPLDTMPILLRSGGIVPMLDPSVVTLAPHTAPGIVSMDDVAGIYDVRAAIDPSAGSGSLELADGTLFATGLADGPVSLPTGIVAAVSEADLATCAACGLVEAAPGGATRVRVSVAGVGAATLQAGALTLRHDSVQPLRVRWDVIVVP